VHLHNKSSEVCVGARSAPASLPSRGRVTEQTTVKWSVAKDSGNFGQKSNGKVCFGFF